MPGLFDRIRSEIVRSLSGDHRRVLIAEDHPDLANVIAMLLGHCGFEVRTAHDGRAVLALARAFRPRFVLLDVKLPGLDGYQVAQRLREDEGLEGTIIIGISAYRPVSRQDSPIDRCFDHYLVKPVELESLLALLRPS